MPWRDTVRTDGNALSTNGQVRAPLLQIRNLEVRFGSDTALQPIDLDVLDGEFLTIVGPSGSGKTTLLRVIAGFQVPSTGRVEFEGRDILNTPINARPFNTVFQDYALFPHMTVRGNVSFGLKVRGVKRNQIEEDVDRVLEIVGLLHLGNRYPAQLSGGQQQRTALARAMICQPRLILLDEPLAALDATMRQQMQSFLKSVQRKSGITFLFVTHDQSEAITMSDRICVLNAGAIMQIGEPRQLYYRPANRFVASFFGDSNLIEPCRVTERADRCALISTPLGQFEVHCDIPDQTRNLVLTVRPEAFVAAGDTHSNTIDFEVEAVNFVGSETVTRLRHAALTDSFTMKSKSASGYRPPAVGSHIQVGFDKDQCSLVPAAEHGS